MKHKFYKLNLVVIFIILISSITTVYANCDVELYNNTSIESEKGIFHLDGSYQFSKTELNRLNEFVKNSKTKKYNNTDADMLKYCAPEYYNSMSQNMQKFLETKEWKNTKPLNMLETRSFYLETTISKYGNSLKGVATINRPNSLFLVAECAICPYLSNEIVGYSYVIKEPSGSQTHVSNASATVVIDPPSGTYWSIGNFTYPIVPIGSTEYELFGLSDSSSSITYINPYE